MSGINKINLFKQNLINLRHIGLDSMCFIYQFTKHPVFSQLTKNILSQLEDNRINAVTSMVTVVEIFVHEEKIGDPFTIQTYEHSLRSIPNLELITIDWNIARFASKLRSKYKVLRTPDALQIASAILSGCNGFITNDAKLKKVKELKVINLADYI